MQAAVPRISTKLASIAVVAATILFSIWLRAAYFPLGIWGSFDDLHFVRLAGHIAEGKWLGPFDYLTLAKGAFFSLFLALNKMTGLPLKISEHLVFLCASLLAAAALARLTGQGRLLLPAFMVLAFCPTAWMTDSARVVREPLYQSLSLLLLCLTAARFLGGSRKSGAGLILGLVAGCYWLTREEGLWLVPALAIPVLFGAMTSFTRMRETGKPFRSVWLKDFLWRLLPPLTVFALVVLLVDGANYVAYGVFRNSDFRAGPFPAAYGALSRIRHDEWTRYVVFPRDARERAYSVSAAARELKPFFEGSPGQYWAATGRNNSVNWGCSEEQPRCRDEILSAWFVWALRDAVAAAGHYRSAVEADAFYTRLADEINAACERQTIPCEGPRASLAPVWRPRYLADTLIASLFVTANLMTLNQGKVEVSPSELTREQAREFRLALNSRISGFNEDDQRVDTLNPTHVRVRLSRGIAAAYAAASPYLFAAALAGYLFLLLSWIRVKSSNVATNSIALLTALLAAILCRVGLLGFLEATSLPANQTLYLVPVVPIYLLFIVMSLGLCAIVALNGVRAKMTRP